MQNYPMTYPSYPQVQQQTFTAPAMPASPAPMSASGATFNIGVPQNNPSQPADPNATNINSSNGVTINIIGAGVYPNGANINNTYTTNNTNTAPAAPNYGRDYYTTQMGQYPPTVPLASTPINNQPEKENKTTAKKEVVLLTDEYIKTLENYIRNDNPDIKLMGAKELMKRFREHDSRKNDPALTALLNLTLQSKYSPVKMVGMSIIENGWAQGDQLTQQLLGQIQQSKSGYGLDALDAASAALKSAGQTIKIDDPNPPKEKSGK